MEESKGVEIDGKWLRNHLPDEVLSKSVREVNSLAGGNLNFVWRIVFDDSSTAIAKYTPPYIASKPTVPFDAERLDFEVRSLQLMGTQEMKKLKERCSTKDIHINTPSVIQVNTRDGVLVMEDMGEQLRDLHEWLLEAEPASARHMGTQLGEFIAGVHCASTAWEQSQRELFFNSNVQKTRESLQYATTGESLGRFAYIDKGVATKASNVARELGKLFAQGPGICFIMGDLWHKSILVGRGKDVHRASIIDWELASYGYPAQDTAHLAAHVWLLHLACRYQKPWIGDMKTALYRKHTGGWKVAEKNCASFLEEFGTNYCLHTHTKLKDQQYFNHFAWHFACEVLTRVGGLFNSGYRFEGLPPDDPLIREAVEVSTGLLLFDSSSSDMFTKDVEVVEAGEEDFQEASDEGERMLSEAALRAKGEDVLKLVLGVKRHTDV